MNPLNLSEFNKLVDVLKSSYISLWQGIKTDFPAPKKRVSFFEQLVNEWRIERFRKGLHKTVVKISQEEHECNILSEKVFSLVKDLEYKTIGNENSIIDYFVEHEYPDVTEVFFAEVKSFDSKMNIYDTFQAIRNVWIMNSIQIILNMKARLTPSIFSYSMLYPYSDNFLDDPGVTEEDKQEFNNRFRECLLGNKVEALDYREDRVFRLVYRIEKEFPRDMYPQVFQSLLAIHTAQEKSIFQQSIESISDEKDLISISFEKGGTSVLADGYLVKGELSKRESDFMFGYGVLLQLIDDLQDVGDDLKNGHMTIFSRASVKGPLDELTNKLFWFVEEILSKSDIFSSEDSIKLKNIIYMSCVMMIIEAISKNRKMFSENYLKQIKDYSMVRLSYFNRLKRKFSRQYSKNDINGILSALACQRNLSNANQI